MKAKRGVLLVALMLGLIAGSVASPVVSAGTWKTDVYTLAPDTWLDEVLLTHQDDKCRQVDVWIKTSAGDMIWLGTRYLCDRDQGMYEAECRQATEVHISYDRADNPFDYTWGMEECQAYEAILLWCGTDYLPMPFWTWVADAGVWNYDSITHSYRFTFHTSTGEEYVSECLDVPPGGTCQRTAYENYTEPIPIIAFELESGPDCVGAEAFYSLWGPGF